MSLRARTLLPSLRGLAAFGYDLVACQTCFLLRLHLLAAWPCVIAKAILAPAN